MYVIKAIETMLELILLKCCTCVAAQAAVIVSKRLPPRGDRAVTVISYYALKKLEQ
jgi:hypothetical protein